jgi:hypothetical protein
MTIFGGFDPGTFQPWALNINQNALGTAGIARGMAVTPTPVTPDMNVVIGVDPIQGDGICFLPNGAWMRIDSPVTLPVPANTSGNSRTDAVVVQVDPTGSFVVSMFYQTNWVYGWFNKTTPYQMAIAQISVPNGASAIAAGNILNTPLQASIGQASPNLLDSVVQDNTPGAQQARIFSEYDIVVADAATSNQTSFNVPLSGRQRLVPMGRIGGADEIGYFASGGGFYAPKLYGSVSGSLPVASVDYVNGNIIAGSGAQAGEQIVASFKVYDFSRDLMVWGGTVLLPRNSPYLVYQGDIHPSTLHLTDDVWDGSLNGVSPVTPGMSIILTYFGHAVQPHFAANGSGQQWSHAFDTGASSTHTIPWTNDIGSYGYGVIVSPGDSGDNIHQVALTYTNGLFDFAGVDISCINANVYVDGGTAVVDGFSVNIANASVPFSPPASGLTSIVYVDRFGNVTSSSFAQVYPLGEALGARIPLSQAVQYVPFTSLSTLYGTYAFPNTPKGLPAVVQLGNLHFGQISLPGNLGAAHGWSMVQDANSPTGGVWLTNSSEDGFTVAAPMTGLDLISTAAATTHIRITVDNVTTYYTNIIPATGGARVRTVLATSWPVATHVISAVVYSQTYNSFAWSPEFLELRYPELPTPPPQTLPLVGVLSVGNTPAWIGKDTLHDAQFQGGSGFFQLQSDLNRYVTGPGIAITNTSTNQSWSQTIHTSGAFRVWFVASTFSGEFDVIVNSSTYVRVDSYSAVAPTVCMAGPFYIPSGLQTITIQGTNVKNAASSDKTILFSGIDFAPPPNLIIDATRFGPDGIRPSVRGSAILAAKGDYLYDQSAGIGTLHLQDRGVTSRKLTPTWQQATSTVSWSGGGTDPYISTTVVVETPSVLMCEVHAGVKMAAGAGAQGNFVLDGTVQGNSTPVFAVDNAGNASTGLQTVSAVSMIPVGPGTHVISVAYSSYGPGAAPFFDGTSQRTLTVLAFAL